MPPTASRRAALLSAGIAAIGLGTAKATAPLLPRGATRLAELIHRLAKTPARRDFTTVPMILNDPAQWDHAALSELIAYRGGPRQVWCNTDIGGGWLDEMANAVNTQVWSFRHPDFIAVSATHGSASLALLDQAAWDKWGIAGLTKGKFTRNTLIVASPAPAANPADYEDEHGFYAGDHNSIPELQRRGVVFLACHNALWGLAGGLIKRGQNPGNLSHAALAAALTNHLVPGVVLTPGIVGTIPELQLAGYLYAES